MKSYLIYSFQRFSKTIKKIENEKKFNDITLSEIEKLQTQSMFQFQNYLQIIKMKGKVINKFFNKEEFIPFPDKSSSSYKIYRIAKSNNFFNLKGF